MELRPLRKGDVESLSAWLPDAAKSIDCERFADPGALRAAGAADILVAIEEDPAGVLQCEIGSPLPDAANVRALFVAPQRRRLGIGGRAALALEQRLAKKAERIYVAVPAELGLVLYFWLRLGYRPLTQAEWPAPPERSPSTWIVRELG
ncbi:MAG: GNAT family N-acetyltransferase [Dehalococcoidia bacterium]